VPITVRLRRPHAAQQQILREAARFNCLAIGRRGGKSALGQHVLATTALDGQPGAYLAPTYKLLAEFWRELVALLRNVTRRKLEDEHRLELITGGVIECWSTDTGDPARGRKYRRVVVDEAAMVPNLTDIWNLAVRPTLVDLEGDAYFLSTPKGLNDFYQLWLLGQDPLAREWASWQMPTSVNPYIPLAEIEQAKRELPERAFAQEFEARFLEIEGAGVFRGVEAVARLKPAQPERGHAYVFGVDWARDLDFTVVSILDASTRQQVALDRFNQVDWEFQTERLHRWARAYSPRLIVAEANAMGGPIISRLQNGYMTVLGQYRAALPLQAWTATNATKAAVVQTLSLAIEQGELSLLDDAVQKGELQAFESTVTQTGLVRYAAPEGMHDDTVIALALAWSGAATESAPSRSKYAFSR
jgi:hypothetical protein